MARDGRERKARRQTPKTCVYCGENAICTDEHVIPSCLFPKASLLPKSDFVIVPVCGPCNNRKSRDDSYVRDALVVDLASSGSPEARALIPRVRRSAEKNWSDFARDATSHVQPVKLFTKAGLYLGNYPGVPIRWKRVNRFFKCVVRGLYWHMEGKRIPDDYMFKVLRLRDDAVRDVFSDFEKKSVLEPCGIGSGVFGVMPLLAEDSPFSTIWLMWFYESIFFTVSTGPKELFDQFGVKGQSALPFTED